MSARATMMMTTWPAAFRSRQAGDQLVSTPGAGRGCSRRGRAQAGFAVFLLRRRTRLRGGWRGDVRDARNGGRPGQCSRKVARVL
jgi:hypothetical protein